MNINLLPVPVAADRLGVSNKTIYRLMARGILRKVKIGRSTRISEQELNAYVAEQFEKGAPQAW